MGSTHTTIRDHADRDGRTDERGHDSPGDHAKVDLCPEGCDRGEREGRDSQAQGGLAEIPDAQGFDHAEAHHGAESHRPEVAEACRRREEGLDHTQAEDGRAQDRRAQGGNHSEAHHSEESHRPEANLGAQARHSEAHHGEESHHAEVAEAYRRREEGRDRTQAEDGRAQDRRAQGGHHSEAHHGEESHRPEAHHGEESHHAEVTEACRRREEGRDRAQAEDGRGAEDLSPSSLGGLR